MEYPGRNRDEGKFAERLAALSSAERRELRDLMGWPPNAANVPDSFFEEAAERRRTESYAMLYLLLLASADYHAGFGEPDDDFTDSIDQQANEWAEDRSRQLATRYAERSRGAFSRLAQRLDALTDATSGRDKIAMTKAEFEDELGKVAGPDRDAETAATNTTAAQTAGGDAAAKDTMGGDSPSDTWVNQPHLTRTGPCERCEALHDKPRSEWASIDSFSSDGPPLHDYCACIIVYANAAVGA